MGGKTAKGQMQKLSCEVLTEEKRIKGEPLGVLLVVRESVRSVQLGDSQKSPLLVFLLLFSFSFFLFSFFSLVLFLFLLILFLLLLLLAYSLPCTA